MLGENGVALGEGKDNFDGFYNIDMNVLKYIDLGQHKSVAPWPGLLSARLS